LDQISSVTKGMIGCRSLRISASVDLATDHDRYRSPSLAPSRRRSTFTISRYQSQ